MDCAQKGVEQPEEALEEASEAAASLVVASTPSSCVPRGGTGSMVCERQPTTRFTRAENRKAKVATPGNSKTRKNHTQQPHPTITASMQLPPPPPPLLPHCTTHLWVVTTQQHIVVVACVRGDALQVERRGALEAREQAATPTGRGRVGCAGGGLAHRTAMGGTHERGGGGGTCTPFPRGHVPDRDRHTHTHTHTHTHVPPRKHTHQCQQRQHTTATKKKKSSSSTGGEGERGRGDEVRCNTMHGLIRSHPPFLANSSRHWKWKKRPHEDTWHLRVPGKGRMR